MMAYYSFVVFVKRPVVIEDPMVLLDSGVNTFSAEVRDLEGFLARLDLEGVKVKQSYRLDDFKPVPLSSTLMPGESLPCLRALEETEN